MAPIFPLEEFPYLLYKDPRAASFFIGVPVRQLSSGQRSAFVDPQVPLLVVNLNNPPLFFPHRPDPFFLVGLYNATLGNDGISAIMAPPAALTHANARFAVPWSSLLWDDTVLGPQVFNIVPFTGFIPVEERTLKVSWTPSPHFSKISRELIFHSFLGLGHSVESIYYTSVGPAWVEAKVVFKSPFSVSCIMGGELQAVPIVLENGHSIWVSQPHPQPDLEAHPLQRRKVYVTFDLSNRVHFIELHNYFERFGPVSEVSIQNVKEGEQPRCAIVTFFSADAVDKILEGASVVTSYIGDKEIRCKPYVPTR